MFRRLVKFPTRCNVNPNQTGDVPQDIVEALDIASKEQMEGIGFKPYATKEVEKQAFTPGQFDRSNWIFSGKVENKQIFDPKELETLAEDIPEICLVGKSNVGKSSLINSLLGGGQQIAFVSRTPGRTQSINLLRVRNMFHLVDMPGYGFAQVSKKHKKRLNVLIEGYVKARPHSTLKLVCVLIDSRRGFSDEDIQLMSFLDDSVHPFLVVLTKIDKMEPIKLTQLIKDLEEKVQTHPYCFPEILVTSSAAHANLGIERLRALIASAADLIRPGE